MLLKEKQLGSSSKIIIILLPSPEIVNTAVNMIIGDL